MSGMLDSTMDVSTQEISSDNVPEAETSPTFKKIGPTHRAKFIGVKYEQKKGQYSSFLRMTRSRKINQIGLFFSEEQAAISHDMQALKTYGLLAHDMLNFSYEYDEEYWNETSQKSLKLRLSGATVIIECDGEEEQEPKGPIPETTIEMSTSDLVAVVPDVVNIEAEVVDSFLCSPPGTAAVLPGKSDVSRRWPERLVSSFYPTAAFAYEVTFMHQSSLGLQLRPLMLTYSVAGGKRTLGCCVVIDSSQSPSPLVLAGDILVSVNGQSLIGPQPLAGSDQRESQREVSGGFSFDSSVKAISQASAPRTIRFLRTAGLSTNQQLSPAEASLLVSDHHPVAKYTVEQSVLPGGTPHQVMIYLDNQVHSPWLISIPTQVKSTLLDLSATCHSYLSQLDRPPSR